MNKRITKADNSPGLSYLDAGVDIDAGNELLERIKPAVKSTNRSGVLTGIAPAPDQIPVDDQDQPVVIDAMSELETDEATDGAITWDFLIDAAVRWKWLKNPALLE